MSDATKCAKCGYVYWTRWNENWGTCDKCRTNNDHYEGKEKPELVSSDWIFKYYDPLLEKAKKVIDEHSKNN